MITLKVNRCGFVGTGHTELGTMNVMKVGIVPYDNCMKTTSSNVLLIVSGTESSVLVPNLAISEIQ